MRPAIPGLLALLLIGGFACAPKDAPTATISGDAFYRERIAVPPDAQLEVFLEDVSRADSPAKLLGSTLIPNAGQPPYAFEVRYNPQEVIAKHRYNLRARLTRGDKLLFTTNQAYPVLNTQTPQKNHLLMVRAGTSKARAEPSGEAASSKAPSTAPDRNLLHTYWKLTTLNGAAVTVFPNQHEAHLVFHEDNQLSGSDGCNRMTGSYQLEGERLSFAQMAGTMMACIKGGEQSQAFKQSLAQAQRFSIHGNSLQLLDNQGATIASFTAVDM